MIHRINKYLALNFFHSRFGSDGEEHGVGGVGKCFNLSSMFVGGVSVDHGRNCYFVSFTLLQIINNDLSKV